MFHPIMRSTSTHAPLSKTEERFADERRGFIALMRPRVIQVRDICIEAVDDIDSIGVYRVQIMACAIDLQSGASLSGFDLVNEIAGSLLNFLTNVTPHTRLHLDLIRAHVDAIMLLMGRYDEKQMAEHGSMMAGGLSLAAKWVLRKHDTDARFSEMIVGSPPEAVRGLVAA